MNYKIYKFVFKSAVHFGEHSLVKSKNVFMSDTFFSAMCIEALKFGEDTFNEFYNGVKNGKLIFSDAFPYMKDKLFVPKPIKKILKENDGDSKTKKAFKKLSYIPIDDMDTYLTGKLNPEQINHELNENFGKYETKVSAAVRGVEETLPYHVQSYRYNNENGLYIIVGYEEEDILYLFDELIESLSYSGIGGKRSSGNGRFEIKVGKMPEKLRSRLENAKDGKTNMSLSICLPEDVELHEAIAESEYLLLKRSGFVESEQYSDNPKRKKDIYMFKAGSCFKKCFKGGIFDVSDGGAHPIYRYGKTMWMEVD